MKYFVNIFLVCVLFILNIFAQSEPDLITDRPDKTESASTVPAGRLQIETGFEHLKEKSDDNSDSNSLQAVGALLRYGIAEKFEIRLGGAFLSQNVVYSSGNSEQNGFADFLIGAKYEIINGNSSVPDLGLMFHLFIPVGAENFKPAKIEPQAILAASKSVTDYMDFGINLGVHHSSFSDKIFYFYTIAAGIDISEKFGSFIELFSEIFSDESPFLSLGAGFTYLLLPNLQLDISGGNGLFNNSKVWYFGAGFSIRIPR
jgi:hypothetical protein